MTTLRHVLIELSKLMAPFTPFIAEKMYQDLGGEKESVHLEDWPEERASRAEKASRASRILEDMKRAREIVTMALEKRSSAKIPVRQALSRMVVRTPGGLSEELRAIVAEEVNVKVVEVVEAVEVIEVELDTTLTPELIQEGMAREVIRRVNDLRKKAGLTIDDRIVVYALAGESDTIRAALEKHEQAILQAARADRMVIGESDTMETFDIGNESVRLDIKNA